MTDLRKKLPCTVNVLGTEYSVVMRARSADKRLEGANGYVDSSVRRIVLCEQTHDEYTVDDIDWFLKKVLRHEIVHAFMYQSGLASNSCLFESGWATNEEMIDWFAIQSPKIFATYKELGIL